MKPLSLVDEIKIQVKAWGLHRGFCFPIRSQPLYSVTGNNPVGDDSVPTGSKPFS